MHSDCGAEYILIPDVVSPWPVGSLLHLVFVPFPQLPTARPHTGHHPSQASPTTEHQPRLRP